MKFDSSSAILVDTNMLLLLVVGSVSPKYVGKIGCTDAYTAEDFRQLRDFVESFNCVITTPHVLSQVSDLVCRGATGELVHQLRSTLHSMYAIGDERFVHARKLVKDQLAARFGLADSGVIEAARRGCSVVSADARLCGELNRRGLSVINFNHFVFGALGSNAD